MSFGSANEKLEIPHMHIDDPQSTLRKSLANLRFWRPHFLPANATVEHLPALAWLSTVLTPRKVIYLGVGQGNGYFTLCQVLNESSSDAALQGFDMWPDAMTNVPLQDIPERLKSHNLENYAHQSRIFLSDAAAAVELVDDSVIDMLVVEKELTPDIVNALRKDWIGNMSPRGVIVLLDRGSARRHIEAEDALIEITASMPCVELPISPGITLLFPGSEPSSLFVMLGAQSNDSDTTALLKEYLALLGSTLAARMTSEALRSALDLQLAENDAFREAVNDREGMSQKLLSQIERLTTTVDSLTISRDQTMGEQAERIRELSDSESKLRQSLAEQDEERFRIQRALERAVIQAGKLEEQIGDLEMAASQMRETFARQVESLLGVQQELAAAIALCGPAQAQDEVPGYMCDRKRSLGSTVALA